MKKLTREYLDGFGWTRIMVGSSVVTYCTRCRRQRTHTCTGRAWEDDDWTYEFQCDHCLYGV